MRGILAVAILGTVVIATARPALTQGAGGASPSTVRAPFVIVDESGKPLMVVKRSTLGGRFGELKILDPEGRGVAGLESFAGRGRVFSEGVLGTSYLGK
jgi:hypothetical protein